jgi:hypothetical protein
VAFGRCSVVGGLRALQRRRAISGAAASSVTFIIQDFMWLEWQKVQE